MSTQICHPKNGNRCAYCTRFTGDANLVFKGPMMGLQYNTSVQAKCMKTGVNTVSNAGSYCEHFTPNMMAQGLL